MGGGNGVLFSDALLIVRKSAGLVVLNWCNCPLKKKIRSDLTFEIAPDTLDTIYRKVWYACWTNFRTNKLYIAGVSPFYNWGIQN